MGLDATWGPPSRHRSFLLRASQGLPCPTRFAPGICERGPAATGWEPRGGALRRGKRRSPFAQHPERSEGHHPLSHKERVYWLPLPEGEGWGEGDLTAWSKMPKTKGHFVSPRMLLRSRDLRHPLTPPEAKVWRRIRDRRLGFKLRRQHPIGRFILDFYCAEARLAIEIDGDIHAAPD